MTPQPLTSLGSDGVPIETTVPLTPAATTKLRQGGQVIVSWDLALRIMAKHAASHEATGSALPDWLDEDDAFAIAMALYERLPNSGPWKLALSAHGVRGRTFEFTTEWLDESGRPLRPQPQQIAPAIIEWNGTRHRLSLPQFQVHSAVSQHAMHRHTLAEDLDATAQIQSFIPRNDPTIVIQGGLGHERVLAIDSIKPQFHKSGNVYQLRPTIPGVDDAFLWKQLRANRNARAGRGIIGVDEDGNRVRTVLSPTALAGLKDAIHLSRRALHPSKVAELLTDPTELGTNLNLADFSERVSGLGPVVMEVEFAGCEVAIGGWFDWDADICLARVGGDGTQVGGMDLKDEHVVASLEAALVKADDGAVAYIPSPDGQGLIQITDALRQVVAEARQRLDAPAEQRPVRVGLQVRQNMENIDFESAEKATPRPLNLRPPRGLLSAFSLKPHQLHGFAWLRGVMKTLPPQGAGAVLADDMGLGKTLQVLALWSDRLADGHLGPHLVVAPVALLTNWMNEAQRFFGDRLDPIVVFQGADAKGRSHKELAAWLQSHRVVLISYESLRRNEFGFARVKWDTAVLDEAQKAKNPETQIARVIRTLRANLRLAVTGTPVENSLRDLWTVYDWAVPGLLGSLRQFKQTYITPISDGGADRAELALTLQERIRPVFLRRMKREVLQELPAIHHHNHAVALSPAQVTLYSHVIRRVQDGEIPSLGSLSHLFGACAHPDLRRGAKILGDLISRPFPKGEKLMSLLEDIRARGEKAIIFANRHAVQYWIADQVAATFGIPSPSIINGKITGSSRRLNIVNTFQRGPGFDVLVLAPRAAGLGLNITAANHVIHYMREWNPAIENQATDRAYRMGQTRDVHVHTITCMAGNGVTVEQRLDELLKSKRRLISEFMIPMGKFEVSPKELVAMEDWRMDAPV